MKSTFMANAGNVTRKWYIVDAEGKTLQIINETIHILR